ncbi:MAG: folate family ECF transporter S component [Lachnospiraceae bacterium]|nr:folate family ECF transporter S component [Lachnospiraceae bacterium]
MNKRSLRTAWNSRMLAILGVLIAMQIILSRMLRIDLGFARITLSSVCPIMAGLWFGPLPGAVCGLTADILGSFLSGYAPNPLITAAAAVWGILPALALYFLGRGSRKRKIIAICAGIVASGLLGTMGLTYAGLVMLGYNPAAIFTARVIQFALMTPIYSILSCCLYFGPVTDFLENITAVSGKKTSWADRTQK